MKYLYILPILFYGQCLQSGEIVLSVDHAIKVAADKYQIPATIINAISIVESNKNPKALNKKDGGSPSYGLLQIKRKTARFLGYHGTIRGLYDPYVNADLGAKYLSQQFKRYNRDWIKAISAYNRGHASTLNTGYVNKVFMEIVKQ